MGLEIMATKKSSSAKKLTSQKVKNFLPAAWCRIRALFSGEGHKTLRTVWRFAMGFFAAMGFAAMVMLVSALITYSKVVNYVPPPLPDSMVLTYTIDNKLVENVNKPSFTRPLLRPPTTLHEVIRALSNARSDKRVKGFVARIDPAGLGLAQVQELRDAVKRFRESGKFALVFSEDFGGFGPGLGAYYLASAFDEIWLQPVGLVSITGLNAEIPFFRETLDKLGIEPLLDQRGSYKTTPESAMRSSMSPENREMMESLIGDLADQMTAAIAEDRKLSVQKVRSYIDQAPIREQPAVEYGLVDKIGYWDVLLDTAQIRGGGEEEGTKLISLTGYLFQSETERSHGGMKAFVHNYFDDTAYDGGQISDKKFALVYASGTVVSSQAGTALDVPGLDEGKMSAKKIAAAIHEATEDEDIDVIIFRIDSPGGSPSASETIRHALQRAKKKGKKIVVSMSNTTASGGYWIASVADQIVAQPATLTGSIGVFGGKMVLRGLWDKVGLNWESVSYGDNAALWSMNQAYDAAERAKMDEMLDHIYAAFVERVAEGRGMTVAEVNRVARGRVWTGRQAEDAGLVDALGGLDKAVEVSKKLVGLTPEDKVLMVRYPAPKSMLEMFVELAMEGADIGPVMPQTRTLNGLITNLLLPADTGIARMPEFYLQ